MHTYSMVLSVGVDFSSLVCFTDPNAVQEWSYRIFCVVLFNIFFLLVLFG